MEKKSKLTAALIFAGALVLAACSGAQSRKQAFIAQGEKHMAERNWQKARVDFRNALQVDPKDAQAKFLLGQAAERAADYSQAAGAYASVLEQDKNHLEARIALARLYARGGAAKDAMKLVEDGLVQHPDNAALLAVRGIAKDQLGDTPGALADGEAAVRLTPGDATAGMLLGSVYQRVGRLADATEAVERASHANADDLNLHLQLAGLYRASGRDDAAAGELRRAIALEPARLDLRLRLSGLYTLQKNLDAAEAVLRDAVQALPGELKAKLALATFIATHRSYDAGEKSLQDLVQANPDDQALRMTLASFYENAGRSALADEVYRDVIKRDPRGEQGLAARDRLAFKELASGNADAASTLVGETLAISPRDNDALIVRANIAVSKGDPSSAISDLRAVLRDQPNAPAVMRALAEAYMAANEGALAEETLRSAMQANPADAKTRLALSSFLLKSGREAEAQAVVDELTAQSPADLEALEAKVRVQVARRDFAAARQTAAQMTELRPDSPSGVFLTGLIDEAQGKPSEALAQFDKALSKAPDAIEPLSAAVRVDLALQQPARAMARVDAALARAPKNAAVSALKGELQMRLKQYDAAVSTLEHTIALQPAWWLPYRDLGRTELAAGRAERAIAAYQRGAQATGNAPVLLLEQAAVQERLGRPEEAMRVYESWLSRSAGSQVAENNLAMLLIQHRSKDRASLDRALELAKPLKESSQPAFVDTYGWVRYVRGEYADAVEALSRVVKMAPGTPLFQAHLGLAQFKAGERAEAKKNLQLALAGGANFSEAAEAREALAQL